MRSPWWPIPWWRAKWASEALPIAWDDQGNGGPWRAPRFAELVRAGLDEQTAQVGRSDGDVAAGLARAVRRMEAEYAVPFLAHATMEPQTCTVSVRPERVEVWAPTQGPVTAALAAAVAADVPDEKVIVHSLMLGGGFGRRGAQSGIYPAGRCYR